MEHELLTFWFDNEHLWFNCSILKITYPYNLPEETPHDDAQPFPAR